MDRGVPSNAYDHTPKRRHGVVRTSRTKQPCVAMGFFGIAVPAMVYGFMKATLAPALVVVAGTMCVVIYRTQKYIWRIDMKDKERRK